MLDNGAHLLHEEKRLPSGWKHREVYTITDIGAALRAMQNDLSKKQLIDDANDCEGFSVFSEVLDTTEGAVWTRIPPTRWLKVNNQDVATQRMVAGRDALKKALNQHGTQGFSRAQPRVLYHDDGTLNNGMQLVGDGCRPVPEASKHREVFTITNIEAAIAHYNQAISEDNHAPADAEETSTEDAHADTSHEEETIPNYTGWSIEKHDGAPTQDTTPTGEGATDGDTDDSGECRDEGMETQGEGLLHILSPEEQRAADESVRMHTHRKTAVISGTGGEEANGDGNTNERVWALDESGTGDEDTNERVYALDESGQEHTPPNTVASRNGTGGEDTEEQHNTSEPSTSVEKRCAGKFTWYSPRCGHSMSVPPGRTARDECALAEVVIHQGGALAVGFAAHTNHPTLTVGVMVAANSGRPGGACGNGAKLCRDNLHPGHSTHSGRSNHNGRVSFLSKTHNIGNCNNAPLPTITHCRAPPPRRNPGGGRGVWLGGRRGGRSVCPYDRPQVRHVSRWTRLHDGRHATGRKLPNHG